MKADINPRNLKLARERLNLSLEDAAKKIGVSNPAHLEAAEIGEENITFKQLQRAANVYDISLGFFYLDEFPYEDIPITDFRMDVDYYGKPKSTALLKTIHTATTKREEIIEISNYLNNELQDFSLSCNITDSIEEVGKKIRLLFSASCFANKGEVIKRLIAQIESLGVYVFKVGGESHNKVSYDEFDGAAIYYEKLPIIILNFDNIDKNRNRIVFTLFHEFVHLLLRNRAITVFNTGSSNNDIQVKSISKIETYCNKVAAAALIPADDVRENFKQDNILDLANGYRVSRAVVVIRLRNLELISQQECGALLQKYKREYDSYTAPRRSSDSVINPNVIKKRNLGDLYINSIRDAISSNYMSYFDGLKSLGMKDKAAKKVLYNE